ncbi:UbiA family prenyltransferase, partial [bacterium]|nr:UbiA family prenyltransferase [bacterium]
DVLLKIFPALITFSLAASSSYIINDIRDAEADRNHVKKKDRVIARGDIAMPLAWFLSFLLFALSLGLSVFVSDLLWLYLTIYIAISLSYTFALKNVVIVDIFVISSGFLIRVLSGGEIFGVEVSNWLFMTVFMVSLFLATGKRAGELVSMGKSAGVHRKSLAVYSTSFLDGILWFSASAALVTYALYTIEERGELFYTVPLAAFGLLRYIFIVKEGKGDPTDALLKDWQIMVVGIIWATVIGLIIYG